jgi:hypothetical protein
MTERVLDRRLNVAPMMIIRIGTAVTCYGC